MKTLVITREDSPEIDLKNFARKNNIKLFHLPLIKTIPLKAEYKIENYDYLIITSQKTLKHFDKVHLLNKNKPVIVSGEKTANVVKKFGFSNVILPDEQSAKGIEEHIYKHNLQDKTFLFLRAKEGRTINVPSIKVIPVYETIFYTPTNIDEFSKLLNKDTYILFSSPSTFKSFKKIFKDYRYILEKINVIPIGNTTKKEIEKEKIKLLFTPEKPSIKSVIETVSKLP